MFAKETGGIRAAETATFSSRSLQGNHIVYLRACQKPLGKNSFYLWAPCDRTRVEKEPAWVGGQVQGLLRIPQAHGARPLVLLDGGEPASEADSQDCEGSREIWTLGEH